MCLVWLSNNNAQAQVIKLADHTNSQSATIGTFQGITFKEAGFSGLYPIPNTNGKEFWTVSDRGMNVDAANANPTACRPTYDKLYGFPSYTPKIHRIRLNTADSSIQILKTITLKRPDGTNTTGIINPAGFGSTTVEIASTDTVQDCANFAAKTAAKDIWGIDSEGIVVDREGNFWICEEGGPTIWKVAPNGVVIKRFTPYANLIGSQSIDVQIDTVFKYRKNNRGFEGVTLAPNGKIYAIIQSPVLNPTKTVGENTRIHRLLEIDPRTNASRMFAYLNDGIIGSGTNQIRLRDWKIGDLAAISDTTFLVLEAAARGVTDIKRVYKININGATPVTSGLYSGKTLEALVDGTGLAANGIVPVQKTLLFDLLANGWPATLDKAEGLAILNDSTIAIGNDNDYGQSSPLENGIATATGKLSHVITFRLQGASKLAGFVSAAPIGVTGPSTYSSPYVIPAATGIKATSILTVGDDVNGYKMVGIPDGLGAYDNQDGTFSLLMNHELGNTSGIARAHGAKGAFVSKWSINKNDLTVQSGKDLMRKVYKWNTSTQSSNPDTSVFAFNRFCSADLPKVSAFYNAATGKGTQERIFMNGEEGGSTGFALAHIASGINEGNTYVLGKFTLATNGSGINAVGGWENLLANPFSQDKTIVAGTNDGGTGVMNNTVVIYTGDKTTTGTEIEKAGLANGTVKFVSVSGSTAEIVNTTDRATNITNGTAFSLSSTSGTTFSRPEDGAWDPRNPNQFYFVTTDRIDQVNDGVGTQIGRSRLWRLNFADITNTDLGGTVDLLLDGTEGQVMFDNMAFDNFGHILLNEDVGNSVHNGKVWEYTIATDQLKLIAKHDPTRFGDVGVSATAPFNVDEETSGIIDASEVLGAGMFLMVDQAHYAIPGELVEGGQLMAFFNPGSFKHVPTISNFTKTGQEDNSISFSKPDFVNAFSDEDGDTIANVKIVSLPVHGNLFLNGVNVGQGQVISPSSLNNLIYVPNSNFFGKDTVLYNSNDRLNYAVNNAMAVLDVQPVNDLPVVSSFNKTTNEDVQMSLALSDFATNFTEVDGDAVSYIQISKAPKKGSLSLNFVSVQEGDIFPSSAFGIIKYTPFSDLNGQDTISWNGSDMAGFALNDAKVLISIVPVNDLPTTKVTSPANTAIFQAGSTITIKADGADKDGTVKKVLFYANLVQLGEDSKFPYEFSWPGVGSGTYNLYTKVIDNDNATVTSATVKITVQGCTGSGSIKREVYHNIPGSLISSLTSNANYPNNPGSVSSLNSFEAPLNFGDNFGSRIIGFVCAPETGNYTFYIAADDKAELWLSADANPSNKQLIASVPFSVNPRAYAKYPSQTSVPVRLIKGVKYFVMALHKEASLNDHLTVAWTLPGGGFQSPIAGNVLSPWTGGTVSREGDISLEEITTDVFVSPVPAYDHIDVTFNSNYAGTTEINIMDALSNVLRKSVANSHQGKNTVKVLLDGLPSGIYFVNVVSGETNTTKRIVVSGK